MDTKRILSIIGPMFNEESLVEQYCRTTIQTLSVLNERYQLELVLVDDGSRDRTWEEMVKMQRSFPGLVTLVKLSRNFGLEGAVKAGLSVAKGDGVVVMDADLQDPPAVVVEMVAQWEAGADIVIGSRESRPSDGFFKRWSASLFYGVLERLSGKLRLEKEAANFRLLDRRAVTHLLELPEVNSVFRVVVPYLGMKTAVVSYERDRRFAGTTKYHFRSLVRYALDGLTSISVEPLRKLGLGVLVGLFVTFAVVVAALWAPDSWRPSLAGTAIVSVLFTILFAILAVMAEYLGQVYTEVKARPISIIYEHRPSNPSLGNGVDK